MIETAPIPEFKEDVLVKEEPVVNVIKKASSGFSEHLPVCPELAPTASLTITKRFSLRHAIVLKGLNKNFQVQTEGSPIFTVREDSKRLASYFCYGLRPFILKIVDKNDVEVLRIKRQFSCTARVIPCFLQSVEVYSQDNFFGTVEQVWKPMAPEYLVKNAERQPVYRVVGPTFVFFKDIEFAIKTMDGQHIGTTCKKFRSLKSYMSLQDSDEFGVTYERNISVEHKLLLFAATLLIDYMYH